MSIFNIVQAAADAPRDPWAPHARQPQPSQLNRRSVSLSASMNAFPSLSAHPIDEEPLHDAADLALPLPSPSPSSSSTDRQTAPSLTNGSSSSNPPTQPPNNGLPSSPFSIPPASAFHEPQRRFTWTTSSNTHDHPINPAQPPSNSFATTGLLSSLPKYRDPVVPPSQQQPAATPPFAPFASSYQQPPQQQIQNIGLLLKRLDDTVFELKSEFRLLYQENERLRYQLKSPKPPQQSYPTSPHFDAQPTETLKDQTLTLPATTTPPGAIGSKPVPDVKPASLPPQPLPTQPPHPDQTENPPSPIPSKPAKPLKKDLPQPAQLPSPAYPSRHEKPRYSPRSPPEYHPSPLGYEAVVYGVEKSLTMDQIRDDLEANDVMLACTPRPLIRTEKSPPLPVHSVVITLVDEDTFRQCIEHSLPINYSMRRVKALRSHPRARKTQHSQRLLLRLETT